MLRPPLHPGFRRLSRYADDDLDARARRKVAGHLERCPRCRAALARIRALDAAAKDLPAPPLPADLRERLLARHRSGETVIVPPAEDPDRPGRAGRGRGWIAAAAVVALAMAGAPFLLPGAELEANRSELVFSPAAPRPGETVQVSYRPGSLLSGEDRLRLRARYLRRDDLPMPGVGRQAAAAELARGRDGVFRGALRLPEGVVYGAFAVEDRGGERVDANGRKTWELLAHGPDGRPLFEALAQRHFDHQSANWELSRENARHAAALYPGRVDAWFMLYLNERASLAGPAADSARDRARARLADFDRAFRARPALDVESELGIIARLAEAVGDTARHRHWRARLLREAPSSLWGVQERVMDIGPMLERDPRRALAALDTLWSQVGAGRPAVVYLPIALYAAQATGDADAIRLWAGRLSRADPRTELGAMLAQHPELREEGMDRLRARLRALERVDDALRPLDRSVGEERRARREEAGHVLADLGAALLESGRRAAALDTLAKATETGWDAALFRRVADLRLQVGDTAGAAAPLALSVADPMHGAAFGDSARVLLGARFGEAAWRSEMERARREMRDRVLERATRRPVRADVRLRDADGRTVRLRETAAGRPTFVAFWSRHCPPSAEQVPRLQRVAAALRARGYAVVTVSEAPTPEFRRYLAERRLTFPVYADAFRELSPALGQWATPEYYVLDAGGHVRFGPHRDLSAIPAQMAVLGARE